MRLTGFVRWAVLIVVGTWTVRASVAGHAETPPETTYPVRGYEIVGSRLLDAREIRTVFAEALGPSVTLPSICRGLARLRSAYVERGYPDAEVTLPGQAIAEGIVHLRVAEGRFLAPVPPVAPPPPSSPRPISFEVRGYDVTGNTLLPSTAIERAFTNAIGPTVTLDQVRRAAAELQRAYRERGFATVSVAVPPQRITNATVRIRVTEGTLAEVRVTGNEHFDSSNVLRALPSLATRGFLDARVFQAELDAANQNPDRQIYPTLGPGPEPGTSALALRVEDRRPLHGRVELNNLATPGTPEWRLATSLRYLNLWQLEHEVGVSYGFSPGAYREVLPTPDYLLTRPLVAHFGAYYRMPLSGPESSKERLLEQPRFGYDEATRQYRLPPAPGRSDLSFFLSGSSSDTGVRHGPEVVVTRTPLLTILSRDSGRGLTENWAAGARFGHPLRTSDSGTLRISLGPDGRSYRLTSYNTNNFEITTVVTNLQGAQTLENRVASPQPARRLAVDYLPLSVSLEYVDTHPGATTTAGLQLLGNFVGDSREFRSLANAPSATAAFGRATSQLGREQRLPGDWVLGGQASGQAATGPLIGNEQFAVGGAGSVRGYFEGDEYGDAGWCLSTEIRTPAWAGRVPTGSKSTTAFQWRGSVFMDFGQRFLLGRDGTPPPEASLWGTGVGVAAHLDGRVDLRVLVGWPLLDTPNTRAGDPRAYLTLGGQF